MRKNRSDGHSRERARHGRQSRHRKGGRTRAGGRGIRHGGHHARPRGGGHHGIGDGRPDHRPASRRHRPIDLRFPGDLRVLVNNAGIDTDYLPVEHAVLDDWRRLFETNVFGVVASPRPPSPPCERTSPLWSCTISVVLDHRLGPLLFRLPGFESCSLCLRRQPQSRGRPLWYPGRRDPARADRHRHVPAQHGRTGCRPLRELPNTGRGYRDTAPRAR